MMTEPSRTAAHRSSPDDAERARLDADLQRLAEVGARRRTGLEASMAAGRDEAARRHLRIAIGGYRGSAAQRAAVGTAAVIGVGGAVAAIASASQLAVPAVLIALTAVLTVATVVPPLASERAIAAESAWVASLPFRLEGYFEVLAGEPGISRIVVYDVAWAGDPPATTLLDDVVAAVDPEARVERTPAMGAVIHGGPISGFTELMSGKTRRLVRNHRIPPSVHALVEQVLVPLHRRHPIDRVSLGSR